jgi:hypothetical protein
MRSRLAWAGSVGVAGAAAWRVVARRRKAAAAGPDPRAEELRQRLDESRSIVSERDEFEEAETPVNHVEEPSDPGVDDRRKSVHDHARSTIDELSGTDPDTRC